MSPSVRLSVGWLVCQTVIISSFAFRAPIRALVCFWKASFTDHGYSLLLRRPIDQALM